jgi:hypothetical protein
VPESRNRRKNVYTPPPPKVDPASKVSPKWLVPVMVASFVIGLVWIVVYYLTSSLTVPVITALGAWNLLIGFAFFGVGFALATRWR